MMNMRGVDGRGGVTGVSGGGEEDPVDDGVEHDLDVAGGGVAEEVGGSAATAGAVEEGATDLGPGDVVEGVAVEGRDPGVEQGIAHRRLPPVDLRAGDDGALDPLVRPVHGRHVPAGGGCGGEERAVTATVEAGVDGAAAAEHPAAGAGDAILGGEGLRRRVSGAALDEREQEALLGQ